MTDIHGGKVPTAELDQNPSGPSGPTDPAVPTAVTGSPDRRPARRAVWAAFLGSSLESFDFYLFAYFSAFFSASVFFPNDDPFVGRLEAFALFALSYVVRPIGAIIFGWVGDRLGRRQTLLITITLMGVATGAIGLLPGYDTIGVAAPLLLVVIRLLQGLSLGGEWGGGILVAVEHAEPKRRGLYAALPQLGSPVGTGIVATLVIVLSAVMPPEDLAAWGWRIPFLLAFPLLLVSLWLRLRIDETPLFKALVAEDRLERVPVLSAFAKHPLAMIVAIGAALLGIGSYSLMNTYTLSYGVAVLGFKYEELSLATLIGSALQLVTIPLFGVWANRIGSARVVLIGAIGTLIITFPMYFLLQFATFPILVGTMIIGGILPTLAWAGLGGLMADVFGGPIRYSALSIAYAVAATISGFIPLITTAIGAASGNAWWHPGIVLAVLSALTLVSAIFAARWRRPVDSLLEA
ncbi:MFS transporter [Schumannella luteola]|uniref:Putative proline/betaine transporter n=1 Tax=Schumannella luteola TaxID=472059 RepID=A0A852YCY8_9MICO|nr:MFS family permease [Schumannella luteola]